MGDRAQVGAIRLLLAARFSGLRLVRSQTAPRAICADRRYLRAGPDDKGVAHLLPLCVVAFGLLAVATVRTLGVWGRRERCRKTVVWRPVPGENSTDAYVSGLGLC